MPFKLRNRQSQHSNHYDITEGKTHRKLAETANSQAPSVFATEISGKGKPTGLVVVVPFVIVDMAARYGSIRHKQSVRTGLGGPELVH